MSLFKPTTIGWPRWFKIGFLAVWLCGWTAFDVALIATIFGADIQWAGGSPPPMWSLIILTAFWTAVGALVLRKILRILRGRER